MTDKTILFTEEMRKTHTILIPTMLPMHFKMISSILNASGYKTELLDNLNSRELTECGLKYVHNDTCYPAILVIGQFINALQSGKYDIDHVALILMQTGGGCRASNYISLLRKALKKAGFEKVPVISLNFTGVENHPGFQLTIPILHRMLYGVLYADLLMLLKNQCLPYEMNKGDSENLAGRLTEELAAELAHTKRLKYKDILKNYLRIIEAFKAVPCKRTNKVKVGIVGEIFVKYSPLGNNNLEKFLIGEGAEVVVPGLLDFCLYCVYNGLVDTKLYGINKLKSGFTKIAYRFLIKKQKDIIKAVNNKSDFTPPGYFDHTRTLVKGYINLGTKMGEGWLLCAEMLELVEMGVKNIVCTQPFGCLPNHIAGKGMMKPIKEKNPDVNIVAIDYDPGATQINQENRIKLMLANVKTSDPLPEKEPAAARS